MRSLLRQLEQIRNTATYDDVVADVYNSNVAEPTVSGTLEGDLNSLRTIVKELKGTSNWFGDLGNYFDPTNTDGSNTENKDLNLSNLKDNTLDSKTVIIGVTANNSGNGYTVASGTDGVILSISTPYATAENRTGLPVYASISGTYYDEGGADTVCRIDVIDNETGASFENSDGDMVCAKFEDGLDHSGSGSGHDVFAKFYANDVEYTLDENDPTSIKFVYPVRRQMSNVSEYEWFRTDFVSAWEGDYELVEDVDNLWGYTGASDNVSSNTWSNTSSWYVLSSNPSSLHAAIQHINDEIGDRNYDEYYLSDGQSVTNSLVALEDAVNDLAAGAVVKYVEAISNVILPNTAHNTPANYTPCSDSGQEGKNMDIYVDGQLLAASTGSNGDQSDRDYSEISTSQVAFSFTLHPGQNITYMIRK